MSAWRNVKTLLRAPMQGCENDNSEVRTNEYMSGISEGAKAYRSTETVTNDSHAGSNPVALTI